MKFTGNIYEEIFDLFRDDSAFAQKLLNYDVKAMQELGLNNTISPEEFISFYESGKIDELYKIAVFKLRKTKLYHNLINEYYLNEAEKLESKKR